jgi:hypothetical protein
MDVVQKPSDTERSPCIWYVWYSYNKRDSFLLFYSFGFETIVSFSIPSLSRYSHYLYTTFYVKRFLSYVSSPTKRWQHDSITSRCRCRESRLIGSWDHIVMPSLLLGAVGARVYDERSARVPPALQDHNIDSMDFQLKYTWSGSGFPSNATLVWIFYLVTATCFSFMTIFRRKNLKMVIRLKHVAVTK